MTTPIRPEPAQGGARPATPRGTRTSLAWVVALEAAAHPHLARVVDLVDGGAPGVVAAVLEPRPDRSLRDWLDERGQIETGEAVTVLVPVLAAIAHLLHRGVVVTRLDAAGVALDPRGSPVVAVAEVRLRDGGLGRESAPGPGAGVAGLVTTVLGAAGATLPPGPETGSGADTLHSLVERIHDLAPPLPLATSSTPGGAAPPRAGAGPPTRGPAPWSDGGPPPPAWLAVLPKGDVLLRVGAWWHAGGLRGLPTVVRSVRPRAWSLVAAVGVSLAAAVVLLGPADGEPAGPGHAAVPGAGAVAEAPGRADSAPSPEGGTPSAPAPAGRLDAVADEDPAGAGRALLDGRDSCLRDLLPDCLREVDQAGSPLLTADLAAVAEPSGGAATPTTCASVDETARWGGTALLACARPGTTAASVLVVRTEAGWRLREVVTSGGEG